MEPGGGGQGRGGLGSLSEAALPGEPARPGLFSTGHTGSDSDHVMDLSKVLFAYRLKLPIRGAARPALRRPCCPARVPSPPPLSLVLHMDKTCHPHTHRLAAPTLCGPNSSAGPALPSTGSGRWCHDVTPSPCTGASPARPVPGSQDLCLRLVTRSQAGASHQHE